MFVNSMSDLFHGDVSDEFIARVWAVMAATPQHTYQILTKRHGRMRSLLGGPTFGDTAVLSNVHLGVSAEDQRAAELRVPHLVETPAAVRFLSCEPLLGPVDLGPWLTTPLVCGCGAGPLAEPPGHSRGCMEREPGVLDWVIVGGESGRDHRPMDVAWLTSIVDQCRAASVPVFVKQDSGARPGRQGRIPDTHWTQEFPHPRVTVGQLGLCDGAPDDAMTWSPEDAEVRP